MTYVAPMPGPFEDLPLQNRTLRAALHGHTG